MANVSLYISRSSSVAIDGRGNVVARSARGFEIGPDAWQVLSAEVRKTCGPAKLRLSLSASLCRHRVSPWISANATPHAMRSQVELEHAEEGILAGTTHHVEIAWPKYGESIISVAYPLDLVDAIKDAFRSERHELRLVESSVAVVLGEMTGKFPERTMLLAFAEGDGISAIHVENDQVAGFEAVAGVDEGYDGVVAWCRRQQCRFERDSQLYWLETAPKPAGFPGNALSLETVGMRAGSHPLMRALA